MTTTPNLPPMPKPDIIDPQRFGPVYIVSTVEQIQRAAYAAGRDAGLEEAAKTAERQECPYASHDVSSCHAWDMASVEAGKAIRALKSKEQV